MLELQEIFLLVRFFNQISCNKGLKAKILCFFLFFLFNPPETGMFQNQKEHFICDITQAEEIQKSASTEFHKWSKNMVNVENRQFEKGNCVFFSYLSEMKTVSMFYNSSLFYYFLYFVSTIFLFWRYLNSNMTSFLSDTLLPFPNLNDLNSRV